MFIGERLWIPAAQCATLISVVVFVAFETFVPFVARAICVSP